jgi:hypothetical protein
MKILHCHQLSSIYVEKKTQDNLNITAFGRRLHKFEKLVSDPYLLYLANKNMFKLKSDGSKLVLCVKTSTLSAFIINKGNNKITELRTILQRESQNS